jgi:hypothetical protein
LAEEANHKGNHKTTLELKLALSVQRGISLVTWSLKDRFSFEDQWLDLCLKEEIYEFCWQEGKESVGKWSQL